MAKIQVTTANTNVFTNAARTVFRDSNGIPYVLSFYSTTIQIQKGNGTAPTSFSSADTVSGGTDPVGVSGAIDSSDIIHISWLDNAGKASPLRYVTFDCDTDTFGTPATLVLDIGEVPATASLYTAIAIDSNDVPHIVYNEYPKISGVNTYVAMYINKVGGSWNAKVNLWYNVGTNVKYMDITIDLNNLPTVVFSKNTLNLNCAIGASNNAISFSSVLIAGDDSKGTSITVNSNGDHWVAFMEETTDHIHIIKHNYSDSWATWQTIIETTYVGNNPNIVAVGTDIYIFYENSDNDIAYNVYDGSSWSGETVLETGIFNSVRAKWGFWVDNDSAGGLVANLTDGTNTGWLNAQGDGGTSEKFGMLVEATNSSNLNNHSTQQLSIILRKLGSPTDTFYCKVYTGGWESTLIATASIDASIPTTTPAFYSLIFDNPIPFDSSDIYFVFERSGSRDIVNCVIASHTDTSGQYDGIAMELKHNGIWADAGSLRELQMVIHLNSIELDYAFIDETATPDIWWDTLSLAGTNSISGTINAEATTSGVLTASGLLSGTIDAEAALTGNLTNALLIRRIFMIT